MKEPLPLLLFRLLFTFSLAAFMGMLYWSSLLIEEDLKIIKRELNEMKSGFSLLRGDLSKLTAQSLEEGFSARKASASEVALPSEDSSDNLLKKDLFFSTTLPQLLGPQFIPKGIRKESIIGKPDHLNPLSEWQHVRTWMNMCSVSLVSQQFGKYETYAPEMAVSMELIEVEGGDVEYRIKLRQDVFWEPLNPLHFSEGVELAPQFQERHPVTAHDFKFFFDVVMNPHVQEGFAVVERAYLNDVETVEVLDDFTLIVRWRPAKHKDKNGEETKQVKYLAEALTGSLIPLPRFVYQYFSDGTKIIPNEDQETYRSSSIWAQNFSHHWANHVIVSCGAWLFDGMTDREIRFKRNANFYNPYAALSDGIEIKFRDSLDVMWNDFKMGHSDSYKVSPNQLSELEQFLKSDSYLKQKEQGFGIKKLSYLDRFYTYIAWNEVRGLFKSKKVRQALTMAIDRDRIIRQNLNGMGVAITGPFFVHSPAYDPKIKPYPFNPVLAEQLLNEEGWADITGNGVLEKMIEGKIVPFRFQLNYYVKDSKVKTICEYVATSLKEIGIECIPNGVDVADLSGIIENKDFDSLCMSWSSGSPPEDPKQIWSSAGATEKGSSNFIGFSNEEADDLIQKLEYERDPSKRIALYHRFDQLIHEEAPYVFLYTPKVNLVYRDYLQNVFIPADRQDLIPGANVGEPDPGIFWVK